MSRVVASSASAAACPQCHCAFMLTADVPRHEIDRRPRRIDCGHTLCSFCVGHQLATAAGCSLCSSPILSIPSVHHALVETLLHAPPGGVVGAMDMVGPVVNGRDGDTRAQDAPSEMDEHTHPTEVVVVNPFVVQPSPSSDSSSTPLFCDSDDCGCVAVVRCLKCALTYCSSCQHPRKLKGHEQVPIAAWREDEEREKRKACTTHAEQHAATWCASCARRVCATCVSSGAHEGHGIEAVEVMAAHGRESFIKDEAARYEGAVRDAEELGRDAEAKQQALLDSIDAASAQASERVRRVCDALVARLGEVQAELSTMKTKATQSFRAARNIAARVRWDIAALDVNATKAALDAVSDEDWVDTLHRDEAAARTWIMRRTRGILDDVHAWRQTKEGVPAGEVVLRMDEQMLLDAIERIGIDDAPTKEEDAQAVDVTETYGVTSSSSEPHDSPFLARPPNDESKEAHEDGAEEAKSSFVAAASEVEACAGSVAPTATSSDSDGEMVSAEDLGSMRSTSLD